LFTDLSIAACPHPLLLQLEKLCRAAADFYDGGTTADACLEQVRLLRSTGKEADVLLLIKQQKLAQVLGQAVKHAFTELFQHVHQLRAGSGMEDSIRHLLNIVHELFESCSQAGGPDTATSSLLVARQLAESGMLARPTCFSKSSALLLLQPVNHTCNERGQCAMVQPAAAGQAQQQQSCTAPVQLLRAVRLYTCAHNAISRFYMWNGHLS
jgi:hypothetical protein